MTRSRKIRQSGDTSPRETALGLLLLAAGVGMAVAFSYLDYMGVTP